MICSPVWSSPFTTSVEDVIFAADAQGRFEFGLGLVGQQNLGDLLAGVQSSPVCLLARDAGDTELSLEYYRPGLVKEERDLSSTKGVLFNRTVSLEFRLQSLEGYLKFLALTNKPGLECSLRHAYGLSRA
jgi:hypothetical protein